MECLIVGSAFSLARRCYDAAVKMRSARYVARLLIAGFIAAAGITPAALFTLSV